MKSILTTIALVLIAATSQAQTKQEEHCKATTKAGNPCKGKPANNTAYCFTHNPNANRCGFIKKNGEPCKMQVKEKGTKCRYHI